MMNDIENDNEKDPIEDAAQVMAGAEESEALAKGKRGKKAKKASKKAKAEVVAENADASVEAETSAAEDTTDAALAGIEWTPEASGLDFEDLARRVAETIAKNESSEEMTAESTLEAQPDGEMAQIGFEKLGEELEAAENDADTGADESNVQFISEDQLLSIIESMLFSTDRPVSVATIKAIFKGTNIRTKDINRALDLLASEFASPTRGVSLEEVNGGYQLRTKSDNAEFLRRLAKVRPFRLSGPALETMAIVAYKQPITKHEIDEIRGVESGHLLRALMERGLVCFIGKSDLPGKPMTYGSTRKFLEIFGLRNIRELPTLGEIDELLPEGIGEVEEERETLSDITDSMSQEMVSTYSEGEEELSKINDQLKVIDTTSDFFEQEKQRERERKDRDRAQDIRERLVLGDAVEAKDKRWLDRYEAKLAAPPASDQAMAEGAAPSMPETEPEPESIGQELEALSNESGELAPSDGEIEGDDDISETVTEAAIDVEGDELDVALADDMDGDELDDLEARPDWDEDSESDPEMNA